MRLHASCVAFAGQGVLITGSSGSGKSSLALNLMALGARLVSDDQTELANCEGQLIAKAAPNLRGKIEARGIGVLAAESKTQSRVAVVISMDEVERERVPSDRHIRLAAIRLPLLHKVESAAFPAAILQYLKGGKVDR